VAPIWTTSLRWAVITVTIALAFVGLKAAPASAQLLWDWDGGQVVGASGRKVIRFSTQFQPGQIIVSFSDRRLYFIDKPGEAVSYPIAVPREEDRWEGVTTISDKKVNPPWTPTQAMLAENPRLPPWVPGGHPMNPLGVRALYLGSSFYRIHGTDSPWTIGTAASKGCIRLYNRDMLDLYPRVELDALVVVTWQRFTTSPPAVQRPEPEAAARKPVQESERSTLGYPNPNSPAVPPERNASAPAWDCQPSPPSGRTVCHKITGYSSH
jgi:lipoprotein-anchoring transpeptidase ErfK/SrfK